MNPVLDHPLLLLRVMIENGFALNQSATTTRLKELSGLDENSFDQAETYLFEKRLIEGMGNSEDGTRWATSAGVDYLAQAMQSRIPLSLNAERIFRLIVNEADKQKHKCMYAHTASEITKLDKPTTEKAFQELFDEGLIESPVRENNGRPASALKWGAVASSEGRNALRRDFRSFQASSSSSNYISNTKMNAKTTGNQIFIGHGRSPLWKDLKDFIQDRIKLPWDEFNRVSVAGITNVARLSEMLDNSGFAFLVMTAEDEQSNGRMIARMNVIHEAGLFQGRLGFNKAIVLLEDGCEEFSNIQGLGQIRFPKGNIKAVFEDIRQVLERENLIPPS